MGRARQTCREIRAIPYAELPQTVDEETGELRDATDQELADIYGLYTQYRGNNKAIVLSVGYEDSQWPGELICGCVGMYGTTRRKMAFDQIKGKPPSHPDEVKVNHGYDALTAKVSDIEDDQEDDDGNITPGRSLTEFERFEHRITKIQGDG